MQWYEKSLEALSGDEVFAVMRLRSEVFVVEQDCVYLDLDDKDAHSLHLFARDQDAKPGTPARAVVRLVPPGISYEEPSIGRVAIDMEARGSGLGQELMERAVRACHRHWPGQGIRISAQEYLIGFYNRLGFETVGEGYLEDGIPHIQMHRPWRGISDWKELHLQAVLECQRILEALPEEALQGTKAHWGGLQVIEHLMRSEGGTWGYLKKKGQANPHELPAAGLESDERGWKLVRALISDAQWSDPTPGALLTPEPSSNTNVQEAMDQWRSSLSRAYGGLEEVFAQSDWWKVEVFNHPMAGRLSLQDTLAFGVAHVRHHVHQLNRIAAGRS